MKLSPTLQKISDAIGDVELSHCFISVDDHCQPVVSMSSSNFKRLLNGAKPTLVEPKYGSRMWLDAEHVIKGVKIKCSNWKVAKVTSETTTY